MSLLILEDRQFLERQQGHILMKIRPRAIRAGIAASFFLLCCHSFAQAPQHEGGIWKAAVPPTLMKGEFDDFDPIGIAAGARIKADCSLNWVNPDDGARYCFSSGTSLEIFLDQPQVNIRRAREGWRRLNAQSLPNQ
jgi:hypothetical protein